MVVPTRFDITPYRLSPFHDNIFKNDTGIFEVFKFILVIYQAWEVLNYIKSHKTFNKMCSCDVIMGRFREIVIVLLQIFTFALKVNDMNSFELEPKQYLDETNRKKHFKFYFMSRNFRASLIFEVLSILFMGMKLYDFARINKTLNIILMVLQESIQFMVIFLALLIALAFSLVPLAQSIWGIYLYGYKTFEHAFCSVLMINYSKGNLNVLQNYNAVWSTLFIFLYYMSIVFLIHAAFHMVQTESVMLRSLRTGLREKSDPFVKEEEQKQVDLGRAA